MRLRTMTFLTLVLAAAAAGSTGLGPMSAARADFDDSAEGASSTALGSPVDPTDSAIQLAGLNPVPAAKPAAGAAPPSASQPDRRSSPTTQPGASTSISDLVTRDLPQSLREKQLLARRDLSATDHSGLVEIHSILKASQKTVESLVAAKKEFDQLAPDLQSSYREKANLIKQVLAKLSPEEQARLLALNPRERAKAILDLIAQYKARQLLNSPTPPGPTPPK